jgi:hypothetical protein
MEINLYKYTQDPNTVNKTLGNPYTVTGYMNNDLEIDSPTIKLASYDLEYNYIYIPVLKRYYFIDDVTIDPNGIWHLQLSIDVLMTFKDEIEHAQITITKQKTNNLDSVGYEKRLTKFKTVEVTNPFDFDEKVTLLIGLNKGVS